jgi:hypothetical protein
LSGFYEHWLPDPILSLTHSSSYLSFLLLILPEDKGSGLDAFSWLSAFEVRVGESRVENTLQSTVRSLVCVEDLDHQDLIGSHARSIVPLVCRVAGGTQRLITLGHLFSSVTAIVSGSTSVHRTKILSRCGSHIADGQRILADRLDGSPDVDDAPTTLGQTSSIVGTEALVKELLSTERTLIDVCEVSGPDFADTVIVTESSFFDLLGDLLPGSPAHNMGEDVDASGASPSNIVSANSCHCKLQGRYLRLLQKFFDLGIHDILDGILLLKLLLRADVLVYLEPLLFE